ncbi:MAG: hypothetical protein OEP95_09225, partial [Myxococcales bacterium]|nr:hypothetical protein [Myxococcales bacterium]
MTDSEVRTGHDGHGSLSLHDPGRHRPLDAEAWSPDLVEDEIRDVIRDFEAARQPDGSWPTHPFESPSRAPRWCQFEGAAGAVVAMRLLREAGYPAPDVSGLLPGIHEHYIRHPDVGHETGLHLGEAGILAPAVLTGAIDDRGVERLLECMRATIGHPARETTSGETGIMHAALTLFRATGERRWAGVYQDAARSLFAAWIQHPPSGVWLWRSDIFGSVRHYYGACHGVAGNAAALLRGADLLPEEWLEIVLARTTEALLQGAIRSGAAVNWPVSADASGTRRLVQWCHGATGIVAALADAPRTGSEASAQLDPLLEEAGEFVWNAGPVPTP